MGLSAALPWGRPFQPRLQTIWPPASPDLQHDKGPGARRGGAGWGRGSSPSPSRWALGGAATGARVAGPSSELEKFPG